MQPKTTDEELHKAILLVLSDYEWHNTARIAAVVGAGSKRVTKALFALNEKRLISTIKEGKVQSHAITARGLKASRLP